MGFLDRKKALILSGAVLCTALCVWIFMMVKIFSGTTNEDKKPEPTGKVEQQKDPDNGNENKDKDKNKDKDPEDKLYQVFRVTAQYDVTMDGERTPVEKKTYDKNGNLLELTHFVNGEINYRGEYTYNEFGKATSIVFYDEVGRVSSRTDQEYDSDGNLIQSSLTNGQGQCEYTSKYEYYADGQLRKEATEYYQQDYPQKSTMTMYREDGQTEESVTVYTAGYIFKAFYSYDSENRITNRTEYFDDEESRRLEYSYVDDTVTRLYYENGFLIQKNIYDTEENLLESYRYDDKVPMLIEKDEYDSEKRPLHKTEYDQYTGEVTDEYVWEYDAAGNLLMHSNSIEGGTIALFIEEYEYDTTGRLVSEKVINRYSNNEIYATTEYTFWEQGKMLSVFTFNGMGEKINEGHNEYDQFGNLITMSRWYRGEDVITSAYEYQAFSIPYEFLTEEDKELLGIE